MIRHVSISKEDQVMPDSECFAWFDTVSDSFFSFSQNQVWRSWDDFECDFLGEFGTKVTLERFRALFPSMKGTDQ